MNRDVTLIYESYRCASVLSNLKPCDTWEGISESDYYSYLISEMPHLLVSLPSGEELEIDPELEHIRTLEELILLFRRLLSGDAIESRTRKGTVYRLKGTEQRNAFMSEISSYLNMFLKHKFNMELDRFLELL